MKKILIILIVFYSQFVYSNEILKKEYEKLENQIESAFEKLKDAKACEGTRQSNEIINWTHNNPWFGSKLINDAIVNIEATLLKDPNFVYGTENYINELEKRLKDRKPKIFKIIEQYRVDDRGVFGFEYHVKDSKLFISKIVKESPADIAGLKVNDEIIAIDDNNFSDFYKKITEISLIPEEDNGHLFGLFIYSKPDEKRKFTIKRKDRLVETILKANRFPIQKRFGYWHDCFGKYLTNNNGYVEGIFQNNEIVKGVWDNDNFRTIKKFPTKSDPYPIYEGIYQDKKEQIKYIGQWKGSSFDGVGYVIFEKPKNYTKNIYKNGFPQDEGFFYQENIANNPYKNTLLNKLLQPIVQEYLSNSNNLFLKITDDPRYQKELKMDFVISDDQLMRQINDLNLQKLKVLDYLDQVKNEYQDDYKKISDIFYSILNKYDFWFGMVKYNNEDYIDDFRSLNSIISSLPKNHELYLTALYIHKYLPPIYSDKKREYKKLMLENIDDYYLFQLESLPKELQFIDYCDLRFNLYWQLTSSYEGTSAFFNKNSEFSDEINKLLKNIGQNSIQCGLEFEKRAYFIKRARFESNINGNYVFSIQLLDEANKIKQLSLYEKHDYLAFAYYMLQDVTKAKQIVNDVVEECEKTNCMRLEDYKNSYIYEKNEALNNDEFVKGLVKNPYLKYMELNSIANTFKYKNEIEKAIFMLKLTVYEAHKVYYEMSLNDPGNIESIRDLFNPYFKVLSSLLITSQRIPEAEEIIKVIKSRNMYAYTLRSKDYLQKEFIPPLNEEEKKLFEKYLALNSSKKFLEFRDQKDEIKINSQIKEFKEFLSYIDSSFINDEDVKRGDQKDENIEKQKSNLIAKTSLDKLKITQDKLKSLNPNAAIIKFLVQDEQIDVIVTTFDKQSNLKIDVNNENLFKDIFKLRLSIINEENDSFLNISRKLYDQLFVGVERYLTARNISQIYISPDQNLSYLPFAALWNGNQFLSQNYEISIYPGLTDENFFNETLEVDNFVGYATSKQYDNFPPLPNSGKEVENILEILPNKKVSSIFIDEEFNQKNFISGINGDYKAVHISTHFSLNSVSYKDSYFLLGNGEKLDLDDFIESYKRKDFKEIYTLSACETAKISKSSDGSDIESLIDMILRNSSKSVLATLWQIPDKSTSIFMQDFYNYLSHGKSKSEALVLTQRKFIKDSKYSNPLHWAAFSIFGNPF